MSNTVTRLERGWAGHFICSDMCRFRRNTLLTKGDARIVVSTVGCMIMEIGGEKKPHEIGLNRHYETMAFRAKFDGRYWDADVSEEISFDSPWAVKNLEDDDIANDQHEQVVAELTQRLEAGEFDVPIDEISHYTWRKSSE